jgi:hypothetical protein
MQLHLAGNVQLRKDLYLRTKPEYRIRTECLEDIIAQVPLAGDTGMDKLGLLLHQKKERSAREAFDAAKNRLTQAVAEGHRLKEAAETERRKRFD